jgi:Ion channel
LANQYSISVSVAFWPALGSDSPVLRVIPWTPTNFPVPPVILPTEIVTRLPAAFCCPSVVAWTNETQQARNDQIKNYVDALYFTITALTTTGFGDITLPGTLGRIISVVIMVCGVTLFLKLARALFQPRKVRFHRPCPQMGASLVSERGCVRR